MKNRLLMPTTILEIPTPPAVDRILAGVLWWGVLGGGGEVVPLRRGPREESAVGVKDQEVRLSAARNR
jgi:hypothetical protein